MALRQNMEEREQGKELKVGWVSVVIRDAGLQVQLFSEFTAQLYVQCTSSPVRYRWSLVRVTYSFSGEICRHTMGDIQIKSTSFLPFLFPFLIFFFLR